MAKNKLPFMAWILLFIVLIMALSPGIFNLSPATGIGIELSGISLLIGGLIVLLWLETRKKKEKR